MAAVASQPSDCIAKTDEINLYKEQYQPNKLLVIDQFISSDYVQAHFLPEIESCRAHIHRVKVGSFKKSGSVSRHNLEKFAPQLFSLYNASWMKQFVEAVVGEKVSLCPPEDPHGIALYCYTEPGDHIGVHYDKSFYRGRRYTVLLGLVQDAAASKLLCYPGANKLNRRKNPRSVYTHPGTLVIFNGDTLWHEVTPLAANEERIVLTMEYVTDNRMSSLNRFISHTKDRFLYFGKK